MCLMVKKPKTKQKPYSNKFNKDFKNGPHIETCILSRVKQITSPGWMHETSALAWCTGKSQGDREEREGEGGSGWGTHVNPWLIHVNV